MSKGFKDLLQKVYECDRKTVAVAVTEDEPVLEAVKAAKEKGIADAILVGDEAKIKEIAAGMNMDLAGFEIINEPDHVRAAHTAVKLVHDGKADMYMKSPDRHQEFLKERAGQRSRTPHRQRRSPTYASLRSRALTASCSYRTLPL